MSAPLEVFCCYAREDQALLEDLRKHLMPLQRQDQIKIWSDTDLNAGAEWEKELHRHLESADIILLLISADFMSSDYCYSTEMGRAMTRHQQGSARVIPVILRSIHWQSAPFAELQAIPTNAIPVRNWPDPDVAFHDIAEHINTVVAKLQEQRAREEAARQVQRELSRAKGYTLEARYQEALVCYEQVLRLDQANGTALFGKATMLYHLGQFDASIEAFTLAEQNAPTATSFSSYHLKARALKRQKRPHESLAAYDQALSKYSKNDFLFSKASLYAEKATLLVELTAFDQALTALEQARHLAPTQARYFEQTGELLLRLRSFEQALTMYKQASYLAPENASYYVWQGDILQRLKRDEDALPAYKQALAIDPVAKLYAEAGEVCLRLARYQEAAEMFEQTIQGTKEPDPYLYAGKGLALFHLESFPEAIACYEKAIQLSEPDTDPRFFHELGNLYDSRAKHYYALEQQHRGQWDRQQHKNDWLLTPTKLKVLQTLGGHRSEVLGLAISPDGTTLASGSNDQTIQFWELPSGREMSNVFNHDSGVLSVAFNSNGTFLACGTYNGNVVPREFPSGNERLSYGRHKGAVRMVAFSPGGTILASGSDDGTIQLWSMATEGRGTLTLTGHTNGVMSIAFNSNGMILASGSADKTIKLWDVASGREPRALTAHKGGIMSVAFSPDGAILASGSHDNTIKLWDVASGRELRSLTGHTDSIWAVAFHPYGNVLASGCYDSTIKLWDVAGGRELCTLTNHTGAVKSLVFSPDGSLLASGGNDRTIKLWGMES